MSDAAHPSRTVQRSLDLVPIGLISVAGVVCVLLDFRLALSLTVLATACAIAGLLEYRKRGRRHADMEASSYDIDRLRSKERRLQEVEYNYRNLFQAMTAAFWVVDFTGVGDLLRGLREHGVDDFASYFASHPDFVRQMMRATTVLDVNDQTNVLFDVSHGGDIAISVEPFWPDASAPVFAAAVIAAVTGAPRFSAETILRDREGREFEALFTACFPADSVARGRILIGVIDISGRVQAQRELQRVQTEFAHSARISLLGELTASIAHEINQPLAAITTNAAASLRWLNRPKPETGEARLLTGRIIADARRAADIIDRVRRMAMRQAPEAQLLSINAVVSEAMAFLRPELLASAVTLRLDLADGLPPARADRTQLHQIIVNLAINALQAMRDEEVRERQLTVLTGRTGEDVRIAVSDTGPGISGEHLPHLFESFFTTKAEGLGIGLPICRSIVEAYGGTIDARNNPDRGCRFEIRLPAAVAEGHTDV